MMSATVVVFGVVQAMQITSRPAYKATATFVPAEPHQPERVVARLTEPLVVDRAVGDMFAIGMLGLPDDAWLVEQLRVRTIDSSSAIEVSFRNDAGPSRGQCCRLGLLDGYQP